MADKKLTKEEADALYDDMHRAMKARLAAQSKQEQQAVSPRSASKAQEKGQGSTAAATRAVGRQSYSKSPAENGAAVPSRAEGSSQLKGLARTKGLATRFTSSRALGGQGVALAVLAFLGCAKITFSALEMSGVARIEEAKAVVARAPAGATWTKEEAKILKSLDARRVELEERNARLEKREDEFVAKERELAVRLTELKELSEKLKGEREKGDKQRHTQLDQLANVYGSMNPPEAAHLLEQLDVQVALSLIERMPEKRMAQILSLMNAQRALELTNLLSNRTR
jgi:flagellar motility protein MotE (MotC chaperone)